VLLVILCVMLAAAIASAIAAALSGDIWATVVMMAVAYLLVKIIDGKVHSG